MSVRAFSYGGGTQSTAALILAAQGKIDFPLFIFANVGEDSENPASLDYVRDYAMPYAAMHGIELVERERGGVNRSLLHKIERLESTLPIPVRMFPSGAPGRRSCTQDFKIDVIARELKARGATVEDPAVVGLGITMDEIERMRSEYDPRAPEQRRSYPLIDMRLHRQHCLQIIADEGLPLPEKSACWFCPYHRTEDWQKMKREQPEQFEKVCALEEMLIERRGKLGHLPVYMSDRGAREQATLRELYTHDQLTFDLGPGDSCDGGYCMT